MSIASLRFNAAPQASNLPAQPAFGSGDKPHRLITVADGYGNRNDDQIMVKKLYDALKGAIADEGFASADLPVQIDTIAQLRDLVYLSQSMDAPLEKMDAHLGFLATRLFEGFKTRVLKPSSEELKDAPVPTKVLLIQGVKDLAQLFRLLGKDWPLESIKPPHGLIIPDNPAEILNSQASQTLSLADMAEKAVQAARGRNAFEVMFEKLHEAFKPDIFDADDAALKEADRLTGRQMSQGLRDLYSLSVLVGAPMGKQPGDSDEPPLASRLRLNA